MKSIVIHLKNKYPGSQVFSSDNSIDVYQNGEHKVALRKNGAGQMVCVSEEMGASDKFCLAPIPKDARVHKLVDGKIGEDEKSSERKTKKDQFLCAKGHKVLSCKELEAKGFEFGPKQETLKSPEKN